MVGMTVGYFYGTKYAANVREAKPAEKIQISHTKNFEKDAYKAVASAPEQPKLASSVINKLAEVSSNHSISAGVKEVRHSLAVNFELTKHTGKSDATDELFGSYTSLVANPTGSQKIEILNPQTGKKSYLEISEAGIKTEDGRLVSFDADSVAKALKKGNLQVDGTINIKVSTVNAYQYKDENGELKTQEAFSVLSLEYHSNDGKTSNVQIALSKALGASEDVALEDAQPIAEITEKFAMVNTEIFVTQENPAQHEVQIYTNAAQIASAYEENTRKLVKEMIKSADMKGEKLNFLHA